MGTLGDAFMRRRVSFPCPACGGMLSGTLDEVRTGRSVRCACGATVRLKEQGRCVEEVRKAMNKFESAMRRAGFRLRYRE
ncbi:MAG: hypothetical protein N2512_07635 [Armatimonadetes bacterium]|nr:hypothetical protein [Armatimonadota bacterium]